MTVIMYCSQLRGRRGQRNRVYQTWLIAFFLAREFVGFPLAFSPSRVQGKPEVACFCIVFILYTH